jgi:DNA-binding NarL/FixJ family response regulator
VLKAKPSSKIRAAREGARAPSSNGRWPGLMLVASEPLTRDGLRAAFAKHFLICATAATLEQAQEAVDRLTPPLAIIVLDPPFWQGSLEEKIGALVSSAPQTSHLALLRSPLPERVRSVVRAGARGILDTATPPAELRRALRRIAEGELAIQPSWVAFLVDTDPRPSEEQRPQLTSTQLLILKLVADGHTTKEISRARNLTAAAVNHAVERAAHLLGTSHRAEAVAKALRLGLIS